MGRARRLWAWRRGLGAGAANMYTYIQYHIDTERIDACAVKTRA